MSTLREQFMELVIREIFLRKGSGFVLKGGAALRSLYGENRLTKDVDLDFTNPKRTAESLHNTISRSIDNAARGLAIRDLVVSRPGKGEQSPRWKLNFSDSLGQEFHVEIEVSRDPKRVVPGNVIQQRFLPQAAKGITRFWVDIYDGPALIATKIAALRAAGHNLWSVIILDWESDTGVPRSADLYDLPSYTNFAGVVVTLDTTKPVPAGTDHNEIWAAALTALKVELGDTPVYFSTKVNPMLWMHEILVHIMC